MYYWNNKKARSETAKKHTETIARQCQDEIAASVAKTVVYGGPDRNPKEDSGGRAYFGMEQSDSITSAFSHKEDKTAILNFASYKNPGGKFLDGSSAQEESLCHSSFLFNVLKEFENYYAYNRKHLNRALYTDRALYSPDVRFWTNDKLYTDTFDVITCAAPNIGAARKYQDVSKEENTEVLRQRLCFIRDIVAEHGVNVLIAGAFGCGVFRQEPKEVAQLFLDVFRRSSVSTIWFPIPDDRNYNAFLSAF